jgi:hypothetical protein
MSTAPPTRLTIETELYESHKSEWLQTHRGEFVVIQGDALLGFFADFHGAYHAGVKKYGIDRDFLVKRIVAQEPVFLVF